MRYLYKVLRFFGITTHRTFRLCLRGIALIVGFVAAFRASVYFEQNDFEGAIIPYVIVAVAAFLEFIMADVLSDRSFPFDTERKLVLMEQRLGNMAIRSITQRLNELILEFSGCDTSRVSSTVHLLTELAPTADHRYRKGLIQLTDYVGPEGGKKGRITLTNQGVIGRCARTGEMESADFADADEYRRAMVREFGFSRDEANRHTASGRSYLAFPLIHGGTIVGVIYFFSSEPQVFPRAADTEELKRASREFLNYLEFAQMI